MIYKSNRTKTIKVHNRKGKIGRNDPCRCGSGLKYKECCLLKEERGITLHAPNHGIGPGSGRVFVGKKAR